MHSNSYLNQKDTFLENWMQFDQIERPFGKYLQTILMTNDFLSFCATFSLCSFIVAVRVEARPDFGGPRQPFRERHSVRWRPQSGWRRWGLDNDITVQGVHLALNATVHILTIIFLVPSIIVLKWVPFVISVQAVLLDQRLRERKKLC